MAVDGVFGPMDPLMKSAVSSPDDKLLLATSSFTEVSL